MGSRVYDDLIICHLDLTALFCQLNLCGPVRSGLMTVVVVVRNIPMDHDVHLITAMRVDLERFMIATGDMGPDGFAKSENLCL